MNFTSVTDAKSAVFPRSICEEMASFKELSKLWEVLTGNVKPLIVDFELPMAKDASLLKKLGERYDSLSPVLKSAIEDLGTRRVMTHKIVTDDGLSYRTMRDLICSGDWNVRVAVYWLSSGMFLDLSIAIKYDNGAGALYTATGVTDLFTYVEDVFEPLIDLGVDDDGKQLIGMKTFIKLYGESIIAIRAEQMDFPDLICEGIGLDMPVVDS